MPLKSNSLKNDYLEKHMSLTPSNATITLEDLVATIKLLEKLKEDFEKKKKLKLPPQAVSGKIVLGVDYHLVKAEPSSACPPFKLDQHLAPTILLYAQSLDSGSAPRESLAWLSNLFGDSGVMGTLIKASRPVPVNPLIEAHFKAEVEKCKVSFQSKSGKQPKEGNTTVSGTVELLSGIWK